MNKQPTFLENKPLDWTFRVTTCVYRDRTLEEQLLPTDTSCWSTRRQTKCISLSTRWRAAQAAESKCATGIHPSLHSLKTSCKGTLVIPKACPKCVRKCRSAMQTSFLMCTAQFELTFLDGHLLQELVPSRSGYVGNFDHILKP